MPSSPKAPANCPTCGSAVRRVRRRAEDTEVQLSSGPGALRRYRCTGSDCHWEGLLPRRVRASRRVARRRLGRQLRAALVPALALAGLLSAVVAVAWQAGLFSTATEQRLYARGEYHDGEPLPQAHPLTRHHAQAQLAASAEAASAGAAAPAPDILSLRYGCVWGQAGRNPYRGSIEQALRTAALPEELVKTIAAKIRARDVTDRLVIRNEGIQAQASGRVFDAQNVALSYGKTLCLGSRVNFAEGHTEPADLYEATTAGGRVVAVMVPEACGNVSVLGQSADGPQVSLRAADANDDPTQVRWMPAVLEGHSTANSRNAAQAVNGSTQEVPEPGTLACVLAALSGWGFLRWWRRRPGPGAVNRPG